jgi:hypothetical protein
MLPRIIRNYLPLIKEYARESRFEICGIITKLRPRLICLENIALDKENDFAIAANAIAPYLGDILCLWHTHTKESHPELLTPSDIALSQRLNVPSFMIHEITGAWDYYDPCNPDPFPAIADKSRQPTNRVGFYIGWQCNDLLWGRTDCFEVVRCYFLGMLGIDIGNFRRPSFQGFPAPGWQTPWIAEENGFILAEEIQTHDVLEIALQGGREASHLAVVVDAVQGLILHQPGFGYLSQISKLGGYWSDRIAIAPSGNKRILRHKNV